MVNVNVMNGSRPMKVKNLKIIDHVGILYGTVDGSSFWEIDKVAYGIMKMCNGEKTIDEIVRKVAEMANLNPEDVKSTILDIIKEMEKLKFIKYV